MINCLKVEKQSAEDVRKFLYENNLLNVDYKIAVEDNYIFLPLIKGLTFDEMMYLYSLEGFVDLVSRDDLQKVTSKPKSHFDILETQLDPDELEFIPRSFDTIGDIVVIEIPEQLWSKRILIGKALMEAHKSIKSVYVKIGKVSGISRIRPVEYLVGEKKTKTIYKEHGVRLSVDITKAYFSPRLSEEHSRIAKQVSSNELIVDLFCGVGPFVIPIAKKVQSTIHAIDINEEAINLLKENITLNKLSGSIHAHVGDCRKIVKQENLINIADRIIMNLPGYAINFVDVACQVLKKEGGIIHFFAFVGGEIPPEEQIVNDFTKAIEENNRTISEIITVRKVRMSAPKQWQMVVDARVK
ncbi:MAG: class I SAM-dependent methyltransferase family protein [Asgard group archaeon]|nr:class I SAM-dependent methyltransferase family protein [Asgard group archaeon]